MDKKDTLTQNLLVKIVVALACIVGLYFVISGVLSSDSKMSSSDQMVLVQLNKIADEINGHCPIQIDPTASLEKVEAIAPRELRLYYEADLPADDDYLEVKDNARQTMLEYIASNSVMEELRKMNILFSFSFDTPADDHLFDFTVTPDEYNNLEK